MDSKFIKFLFLLTLQFDVWSRTIHPSSEVKLWLLGSINFNLQIRIRSFGLFRFLWLLAFHWHRNFKIWISFGHSIWRFSLRCLFRGFFDSWFSIIHNKSISYPKMTNYISINSIFSLVSEHIIFVIFWLCLIFWFYSTPMITCIYNLNSYPN